MATIDIADRPTLLALLSKVPDTVVTDEELNSITNSLGGNFIRSIQYGTWNCAQSTNVTISKPVSPNKVLLFIRNENTVYYDVGHLNNLTTINVKQSGSFQPNLSKEMLTHTSQSEFERNLSSGKLVFPTNFNYGSRATNWTLIEFY